MTSMGAIAAVLTPKTHDIGALTVGRLLPSKEQRSVGPFVFFDYMGPATLGPGHGIQVRPHPHINLATMTYLFEGQLEHRDSLGVHQSIRPGELNWMVAGRGIVHSERSSPEQTEAEAPIHGIQLWIGLPTRYEEVEPSFHHHGSQASPTRTVGGVRVRVLAGEAFGEAGPIRGHSPLFYVDAQADYGGELLMPTEYSERALFPVAGQVACNGAQVAVGSMAVLNAGAEARVRLSSGSRVMLLGGEPLDGPRHLFWNFVSSSKERIEQAKRDWKEGRFAKVPGDEQEFIPLPE